MLLNGIGKATVSWVAGQARNDKLGSLVLTYFKPYQALARAFLA